MTRERELANRAFRWFAGWICFCIGVGLLVYYFLWRF